MPPADMQTTKMSTASWLLLGAMVGALACVRTRCSVPNPAALPSFPIHGDVPELAAGGCLVASAFFAGSNIALELLVSQQDGVSSSSESSTNSVRRALALDSSSQPLGARNAACTDGRQRGHVYCYGSGCAWGTTQCSTADCASFSSSGSKF